MLEGGEAGRERSEAAEGEGNGLALLVTLRERPHDAPVTVGADPEPGWLRLGLPGAGTGPVRVNGLRLIDALEALLED
ncbi:MAG: hypothetical protein QM767_04030 [Anaeromyxobacter sp.]